MKNYKKLVNYVLKKGKIRTDRTGTGTRSIFGYQMKFDLRKGFPLLTTKYVNFNSVVKELLWFIRGETNINTLGCSIWDAWADENGELGPIYGKQWRRWEAPNGVYIDQLKNVIEEIKKAPDSRRLLVSAWNASDIPNMALPPCHTMFQFYVDGKFLDLQLYQRSGDIALGIPFNIASYSLLLALVAKETKLKPRFFIHSLGDAHIYENHISSITEQMERPELKLPRIKLRNKSIFQVKLEDIELHNYVYGPAIKFKTAV